mgnify:CR=1 FL=1
MWSGENSARLAGHDEDPDVLAPGAVAFDADNLQPLPHHGHLQLLRVETQHLWRFANGLHQGQRQAVLSGRDLHTATTQTLFPGEVPAELPTAELFARHQFQFPAFLPTDNNPEQPLPHVRMDHALEFLLGDKLL